MLTTVHQIDRGDLDVMRDLVANAIPNLVWRHNSLGLLQAYVREGTTDELRVHVWHPSLKRPGIEDSGLMHDHRFDLTSRLLFGTIEQIEYELTPDNGAARVETSWQLSEVVAARKVERGHFGSTIKTLPERYTRAINVIRVLEGQAYSFPKRCFHQTVPTPILSSGFVITLLSKTRQDEDPARILHPYGTTPTHAFADPLPRDVWQPLLNQVPNLLREAMACYTGGR